jgi:GDPmannose 4,6-dehydratase
MWMMLQQNAPKDYVIGTNTAHTVRECCQIAFAHVGLDWQEHVASDTRLLRPTEIKDLNGDYALANRELGWAPRTPFEDLIKLMVDADLERFR